MRFRSLAGLLAGSLLTAVGCSGDDDGASPTTSEAQATSTVVPTTVPPTTLEPTTTVAPTTTAVPTTTALVETTSPPTSEPTTSTTLPDPVPPRVTFPDDPEKQAVVDAAYSYFDALNRAQADPANERLRTAVANATDRPIRQRVIAYLDRLVSDGQAFVDLGDSVSQLIVFREGVSLVGQSAVVDGCVVDRTSQVNVDSEADRPHVIDSRVIAALLSYSVTNTQDGWKVVDLVVVDRFEGSDQCDG